MNKNQMMPLQSGESFPFMGGLWMQSVQIQGFLFKYLLKCYIKAGLLNGVSRVEVWRKMDGTVKVRIATLCEICQRGACLYELDMGFS